MIRNLVSIRREVQGKIVTIFAADNPRNDCEELEGVFPYRFPPSCRGFRSSTSSPHNHNHRRWESIGGRGTTTDRGRKGDNRNAITKGVW